MPENRQYAGPSDAAELMVSDGSYVTVVRNDLSDEQAHTLGYTFDGDEAVGSGRPLARRTITVSDELGRKLDGAGFERDGEFVDSWPKVGGTASAENVVDDETLPATRPVRVSDDPDAELVASSEVDRIAYDAAAAERAEQAPELVLDPEAQDAAVRDARDARINELNAAITDAEQARNAKRSALSDADADDAADLDEQVDALDTDIKRLVAERAELINLNAQGA